MSLITTEPIPINVLLPTFIPFKIEAEGATHTLSPNEHFQLFAIVQLAYNFQFLHCEQYEPGYLF